MYQQQALASFLKHRKGKNVTKQTSYSKKLWGLNAVLASISLILFTYQSTSDQDLSERKTLMEDLRQKSVLRLQNQTFLKEKKLILKKMTNDNFLTSSPPPYHLIKERLINAARARHLEKVRIKGAEPSRTQNLHMRPLNVFLQASLDTDVYHFMNDVKENLAGLTKWTFFSLFFTPHGTVQGELEGEFYVHEK